ncbi:NAD(P)-binding domain-containing protein [Paracoccus xiamenensis]
MKPTISILGTGRMGSALAAALLQAGYHTSV